MQPVLEQAEGRVLASCPAVTVAQHSQRRCKTIYIRVLEELSSCENTHMGIGSAAF